VGAQSELQHRKEDFFFSVTFPCCIKIVAYGTGKCISNSSSTSSSSSSSGGGGGSSGSGSSMCACVRAQLVVTSEETDWRSTLNKVYYANGNHKVV